MTRIYFLRHGPALRRDEWDGADSLRPLSDGGEVVVRDVSRRIATLNLGLGVLLTSPYERALRTAVILHELAEETPPPIEDRRLEPSRFTIDSFARMLEPYKDAGAIMIVGHEPSMTEVLSDIVGGGSFVLRKAGLARVDVDSTDMTTGVLKWFAPPRLLRG